MAKRSQYSYGNVPMIHHSRSKFDLSYSHKSTLNVGDLVPLYCQEVYPGDSFKCDANVVARVTSSFLKPVIDNLFCDVMFFFVPSRTVFNQWAEIFGENNTSAWARPSSVSSPLLSNDSSNPSTVQVGDLSNYLALPISFVDDSFDTIGSISVLPFRAYAKIYNEWYRDENLVDPVNVHIGNVSSSESLNNLPFGPTNYTGKCAKVSKMHDYFTQLLPSPTKGESISIGSAVLPQITAPVITVPGSNLSAYPPVMSGLQWLNVNTKSLQNGPSATSMLSLGIAGGGLNGATAYSNDSTLSTTSSQRVVPNNLSAIIPETALGSVDVNDLRYAFQLQRMLERDAIFGTRFTEYLQGHFGVNSPDGRLQRSEFLGGRRFPLNIIQATQTSDGTSSSPLGNVAGWSLTNGRAGFTKGFTEHGFILGLFCVRQFHTYQQGIEKFWFRHNRLDYLDPLFTSIGYQPVFTKELYTGSDVGSDTVFGYAPAFEDLRCRQNRISGQLSTGASEGLDIWHFGDNYSSQPILGQEFIEETSKYVDRTLSVPSETVDNFIFDVYFKQYAIRVMPTYGMPGLIDHH